MKLNIGCGFNKLDGYLNVDRFPECRPDVLWDLETTPWPFGDSVVEELVAHHVLEHLGQQTEVFFGILKELYRVMRPGGLVRITVPHPLHPTFLADPTHVRSFTVDTFSMMSRAKCLDWAERNVNMTMLALMLDIDFEPIETFHTYDRAWRARINSGEMTIEQVRGEAQVKFGVIQEIKATLKAIKD